VFHLVIKNGRALVHLFQAFGLVVDNVAGHAVEEHHLQSGIDPLGMGPREAVYRGQVLLMLAGSCSIGGLRGVRHRRLLLHLLRLVVNSGNTTIRVIKLHVRLVVVRDHIIIRISREVKGVVVLPEERTHGDVPDPKTTVLFDQSGDDG
jgi:hypothetical protein